MNKNLKWIIKKMKASKLTLVIYTFLVILAAIVNVAIAYVLKLFIDVATGDTDLSFRNVVIISVVVLLASGFIEISAKIIETKIQAKCELNLRKDVLGHIMYGKYQDIEQIHSGDIFNKMTEDIRTISSVYSYIIGNFILNIFLVAMAIIALFALSYRIAIALLIAMPVLIFLISLFNAPIGKADEKKKESEERNRVLLQEYILKLKTIRLYHVQDRFVRQYEKDYKDVYHKKIVFSIWEGIASFLNSLIGNVMLLVTLGLGTYFVLNGKATIGSLIAIVQLLNYVTAPFSNLADGMSKITQSKVSAERIKELVESNVELTEDEHRTVDVDQLIVENLGFAYGDNKILENQNIKFEKGKSYCIVGENGCGKTTLLNILSGLYKQDEGDVYIVKNDGKIEKNTRSYVSLLSADEQIFFGSLIDNITLFSDNYDAEKIKKIEKLTKISEIADSKDQNYETQLNESGKSVSSGQAQQISLARALYYEREILLLDEPTANMDTDAVKLFVETIDKVKKDHIVIIVTHDPQVADECDYKVELTKLAS